MNRWLLEQKHGRRTRTGDGPTLLETADQITGRVARSLGEVERAYGADEAAVTQWSNRFRDLLTNNLFWPSGRILNGCGARVNHLASCYVIPLIDDFGELFQALALAGTVHRSGGGTGFDLSSIREAGAGIESLEAAGGCGPVPWLHLFDAETTLTMQGGRMRGANLASLSVRHPDILAFIDAKLVPGTLANFNISVAIDDAFMHSLAAGESIDLVSPSSGSTVRSIPAREIWERLSTNAWRTGDPGVLFVDSINRGNPLAKHLGPITTTNPCGEQTLYPFEPSTLGSVNLAAFAQGRTIDWALLKRTFADATRLLDNTIDASDYPDQRMTTAANDNRRLGLGVMGFADLLVKLRIPYDSERALSLVDDIGSVMKEVCWSVSKALAKERGPFPNWKYTGLSEPTRNCAITSIAPTGTISMVANCSPSIEPRFASAWNKDVLTDNGIDYVDTDLVSDVAIAASLSIHEATELVRVTTVDKLPIDTASRAVYRYAHDVPHEWHVQMAARWQRYVDNAISKTVNLPTDATVADVAETYRLCWEMGCKGTALYREGSRQRDLLESTVGSDSIDTHRQSKAFLSNPVQPVATS